MYISLRIEADLCCFVWEMYRVYHKLFICVEAFDLHVIPGILGLVIYVIWISRRMNRKMGKTKKPAMELVDC